MKRKEQHSALAVSVYVLALKKQIEEEVKSKYLKRIDHLVGANNELMKELEHWEKEIITVSKERAFEKPVMFQGPIKSTEKEEYKEGGGVHDGDGLSEEK